MHLNKKMVRSSSLGSSVLIVVVLAIMTKAIGFIKQIVIASVFGANAQTDAFYLAFGLITSITYAIFYAINVVLIPHCQKLRIKTHQLSAFISNALFLFLIITIGLSIILFYYSDSISSLLVSPSSQISIKDISHYFVLLLPILTLGCINTVLGSVMEANKIFTYSKSLGVIISVCIILSVLLFNELIYLDCLVLGILVGYGIQLVILFFSIKKLIQFKRPNVKNNFYIKNLLFSIFPLLLGNSIYEFNKTIDRFLSTGFSIGSASALSYGQSLFDSLCALTITSVISVLFSYASDFVSNNRFEKLIETIDKCIIYLYILIMPIAFLIIINGYYIVRIIYGYGLFDNHAIYNTYLVLCGYAIGLPFLILREIFTKIHFAFQDTKNPTKNSILAVLVNIIASIILSRFMGIIGITIATSFAYAISSFLMIISLKKHLKYSFNPILPKVSKILISLLLTAVLNLFLNYFHAHQILIIFISVISYFVILYLFRLEELVYLYFKVRGIILK